MVESLASIQIFLHQYCEALSAGDAKRVVKYFAEPLTISTPDILVSFPSVRAAQMNVAALLEKYQRYGFAQAVIQDLNVTPYPSGHAIAHATWQLRTAANEPIVAFDTTYILKAQADQWKITFVIAHNEIERFAALEKPSA